MTIYKKTKEGDKIEDVGNESYSLYLHYKNDNHVLFIGNVTATGWIKSFVRDYLEGDPFGTLTFTMVEI